MQGMKLNHSVQNVLPNLSRQQIVIKRIFQLSYLLITM